MIQKRALFLLQHLGEKFSWIFPLLCGLRNRDIIYIYTNEIQVLIFFYLKHMLMTENQLHLDNNNMACVREQQAPTVIYKIFHAL